MTIEQELIKLLHGNGMFEDQCVAVIERVKSAEGNEGMKGRWQDPVTDYPDILFRALWLSTKQHALKYIDAELPLAWFRPMFAEGIPGP